MEKVMRKGNSHAVFEENDGSKYRCSGDCCDGT